MRTNLVAVISLFCISAFCEEKKEITIAKIQDSPHIDGILDEAIWMECDIATDLKQNTPLTGQNATQRTEIRIAHDNTAIYVGAIMYDTRDSMSLTLSQRDDFGNADWFGVILDPYNAGTIGFAFLVTSAGVQIDELHQVDDVDANWNAVWQSAVTVHNDKWIAELKIPFSAIRFPKGEQKDWGVNFARNIRRNREQSYWNFYDPNGYNLISQLGLIKGIDDVETPLRLSFTPYVSGYIENYNGSTGYTANGGMDLKYGVNDAFTIDMTLIPDFGQVQFDNKVLNLSPFEVQYNERRQFFTEGTELFNKWDLFYSRRIGGVPVNYSNAYYSLDSNEVVEQNPTSTQLLNATKFSGRTKHGTGIGIFNAITGKTYAVLSDTVSGEKRSVLTSPLSNYNVLVFDQNLKNNSSITFTNTNVMRMGKTYDANVTGIGYDIYTKGQKYNIWGQYAMSQKYYETNVQLGHIIQAGIDKSAGKFRWGLVYREYGKNYDPNDLGYFPLNNLRESAAYIRYNKFEPFWRLYKMWTSLSIGTQRIISPDAYAHSFINMDVGGTFKNFMTAGAWLYSEPFKNHDYFEPRVQGRFYENDRSVAVGGFISSNYGKPFALDMNVGYAIFDDENRWGLDWTVSPRLRFSDHYFMVYTMSLGLASNEEGAALTYDFDLPFDGVDPIFSVRDRQTITNTIDATYIFNNKMGITFRLRHYWSKVSYDEFFALNDDGTFRPTSYTGYDVNDKSLHDNSYNAFTIDMVYRWVFAPGSELRVVWKNSIYNYSQDVALNYFQNVGDMTGIPATNSISLKLLYYIDYWRLHQKIFHRD